MILTFRQRQNSQAITLQELNDFETLIGYALPSDYRQHMLSHNGSMVVQNVSHVNYPGGGEGISYFDPIKYGSHTMEVVYANLNGKIPNGYLSIGLTNNGANIIMSLNNDATYGHIKEYFPDGELLDLSTSFTQLLNDMIEDED
jgi:hypothetical protein